MSRFFVFFTVILFASSLYAETFNPEQKAKLREQLCQSQEKTPQQKCRAIRGKWKNGYCLKWRTKWRRKKCPECTPMVIRVIKYRDKIVYKKIKECVACPKVAKLQSKTSTKTPKIKKRKWWWIGPGVFALGLYMPDVEEFQMGVYGKMVFAINDRFRVNGILGASLWQDVNLYSAVGLDIRLWRDLFLVASFNTLWGDYDDMEVKRRYLLAGMGVSYWFLNRIEASLQFILGTKKETLDCGSTPDRFVGGNIASVQVYF